jgi:2-succinyl-6-hydroxy-2,4-cyclohexadiene-1-carboxylate synthase
VWLHGFTQTKNSAHQFRTILAGTCEVVVVDLPGHGENAAIKASLDETADLLAEALPAEPFILGGYSLGARVALNFALRHHDRLRRLVLLGASRGIEDLVLRSQRRRRDEALADRIESIGAAAFLDEWLGQSMFSTLPADPIERAARSNDAHGLASSLRLAGTGTQDWLGPRLATITVPTLALAGANDEKFSLEAAAIASSVVVGTARVVPEARHAAHLEQPASCASMVQQFTA